MTESMIFYFAARSSLVVHMHTGERKYHCTLCPKTFIQACALGTHRKRHAGHKDHKCDICSRVFIIAGDLRRHRHVHSIIKPLKCDQYKKTFIRRESLRHHLKSHSDGKDHIVVMHITEILVKDGKFLPWLTDVYRHTNIFYKYLCNTLAETLSMS